MGERRAVANVLGVMVDSLDLERALARIADMMGRRQKGYVCAVSVHGVLEARRNPRVARVFAEAAMVTPDGTPMGQSAMRSSKVGVRPVHTTGFARRPSSLNG